MHRIYIPGLQNAQKLSNKTTPIYKTHTIANTLTKRKKKWRRQKPRAKAGSLIKLRKKKIQTS